MDYLCGTMYTLEEIDRFIERSSRVMDFRRTPENLYQPIEYMLSIGGKRIRPKLCLAAYSLFKEDFGNQVVMPALALELFHEFTLIHDDIMDKSDTRRGQMTVHKKWNDNIAILSGDVMSILAFKYLSEAPGEVLPQVLSLFTDTACKVCEGQQKDMDFEQLPFITMDEYISMIGMKTAVLLACSAKMGALIAGVPAGICDALYDFGYQLGIAFQITDDYLDTFGNEKIFGKKIGGDISNNKKTWLLVECMHRALGEDKAHLAELLAMKEDRREEKIAAMQQMYASLGVKEAAEQAILEYHEKAMSVIASLDLPADRLELLTAYAEQLIHRER